MAVEKYKLGSVATLLGTELNSLASNSAAIASSAFNNVQGGGGGDGYTLADVELVVTYGSAPTASTAVEMWFLKAPDGTNYEDGSSSVTPARLPDRTFPLRPASGEQRIVRQVAIPWGPFKTLVKNTGTGQAMASSGNTLKILPVTREGV